MRRGWPRLRIGNSTVRRCNGAWQLSAAIDLGDIGADDVRVDIYAEPRGSGPPVIISMKRGVPVSGSVTGYIYAGAAPASRAVEDCTIRVVPTRPGIVGPAELEFILWQK